MHHSSRQQFLDELLRINGLFETVMQAISGNLLVQNATKFWLHCQSNGGPGLCIFLLYIGKHCAPCIVLDVRCFLLDSLQ